MKKTTNYQEKTKTELITLLQLMDKNILDVVEEKNTIIQQNHSVIQKHEATIQQLLEALRLNRYRLYGAKSEKHNPDQLELELGVFNEAFTPENVEEIESAEEDITVAAHVRKRTPGRKPLPKEFPRYQIIHDLTEEQKQCGCGHTLSCFSEEKTEQLEIVPLKVYVIEHIEKNIAVNSVKKLFAKPRNLYNRSLEAWQALDYWRMF